MRFFARSNARVGKRSAPSLGRGLVATLGLLLALDATAAESKLSLARLKADADQVWQLNEQGDNTEAGKQSGALVRAADALRDGGQLAEAREYYRRAGLVRPWDLEVKLRQADVLKLLGDVAGARTVAKQVLKFAETDQLLATARALAEVPEPAPLPPLTEIQPAAGEVVLGLVAAPETDRWLLNAVGRRLAEKLGVRVGIAATDFTVGDPNRNGRAQIAKELRTSLPWEDPRLLLSGPGGNRIKQEQLTDEQVIQAMQMFLKRDGQPGQVESFEARLTEADKVKQWDVTVLLGRLREEKPQPAQGRVVYLALVPVDLYAGRANFLFGSADVAGNYAVVSYYRYAASFTGEPPRSSRLTERTCKQMLSSTGFALGVARCADPGCARSYPRSLVEHDAKGSDLCDECRAGFAKAFGHEVPAAREE